MIKRQTVYRIVKVVIGAIKYVLIVATVVVTMNATSVKTYAQTSNESYVNNWRISAHFGETNDVHSTPHKGVDFAIKTGTPIKSITNGKVVAILDRGNEGCGKTIHIRDNQGHTIIYGHLSEFKVKSGQAVHNGDVIALSGNTGHSTGPHLHLQINVNGKPINPMSHIKEAGVKGIIGK
ncbi:MAG: hypothetical protein K0R18_153 [Bacillales bacterium]|jgi:murein DD-endopeptidase MepM/ murein hydrolase activator NlpD|nr:hypothetical protein [Bacillales bacterium]